MRIGPIRQAWNHSAGHSPGSSASALLLVTFRPEFPPPWIGRPHVTALTLNRLAERDIEAMIDRVVGNKLIPPNIRQDIIERTDGIPLFVEEMTKAVLEAEGEDEARRTAAAVPSPALDDPASLQASLMARLDRLGPAKEVAQIGSTIGRGFSHALLAAWRANRRRSSIGARAAHRRRFVVPQGVPPQASYRFKHALVQDAAYGTLLREPRRVLHPRIAEILESQFATSPRPNRNCSRITSPRRSSTRRMRECGRSRTAVAGALGTGRSRRTVTQALDQITSLSATAALRREQIRLQVAPITPLIHVKGYAAPETKTAHGASASANRTS